MIFRFPDYFILLPGVVEADRRIREQKREKKRIAVKVLRFETCILKEYFKGLFNVT